MSAFVFLGPSLPCEHARRELPDATFLPPARRGDVYRLVASGRPTAIGLIDGLFDTVPAVVHKEILFALSRGVHVLGAASMGALRAAELWPYGMEGVGRIFERFRSGEWDADDEVAVLHGTADVGWRSGSVALATIRLALEAAQAEGCVSADSAATLVAAAQARFYPDRSWEALDADGAQAGVPAAELAALRAFVARERPDAKRDDALALLARLRELTADEPEPFVAAFDFEPTMFWERIVAEAHASSVDGDAPEGGVAHDEIARHVRVGRESEELTRGAVLLHLLAAEARRRGASFEPDQLQAALNRLRRRHGLLDAERTRAWMSAQGLDEAQLTRLLELELVLAAVRQEAAGSVRGMLALELARRGELADVATAVARKRALLDERGVSSLTPADLGISFEQLLGWYQAERGSIEGSLEAHAQQLGFASVRELVSELLLERAFADGEATPSS